MDRQIKAVLIVLIINFSLIPIFSSYTAYYLPRTHDFIIQETGLGENHTWGASIFKYSGSALEKIASVTSHGSEIVKKLPYGYYTFTVITPSGYMSPLTGSDFHLSSSSPLQKQHIDFLKLYSTVFTENGLSAPYNWSVTLNDHGSAVTHSSNSSNVYFTIPSGNYSYRAAYSSSSGNVEYYPQTQYIVDKNGFSPVDFTPSDLNVNVNFTTSTYAVTFNISSSQQLISENINGVSLTLNGHISYFQYSFYNHTYLPVTVELPNGTYQYVSDNLTGYTISNGWGYVQVDGTTLFRDISYQYGNSQQG